MAKLPYKTNRQVLTKLIKDLDDMDLAVLRERILTVATAVVESKAELMESMKNSFIHPRLYVGAMERTLEIIKFED